ncbi:Oidioi.mRNA.OKI2018_I69.chr1.g3827.t1.cds [Oikopleura dioica]|uniref:Oidioi.mRNA.OKI2018_I69.chr1.g3827.t1.cds n=1 Tax=Oikopleura dioica TaxID=34765 RepID=A0ABN7T0W1_OIKDI|nr:Oidioi.mRNA.OKI2018_I69.chr1.g3827.t1.cds [Oikopleura dioica]
MVRKRQQTPFRKSVGTSAKSTKEPEKIEETTDTGDDMKRQMMQMMGKFQKFVASDSQQARKTAPKQDQGKNGQKEKKELVLENINQAISAMESYKANFVKMDTLLEKINAIGKNKEDANPQEILNETLRELETKQQDEEGILI